MALDPNSVRRVSSEYSEQSESTMAAVGKGLKAMQTFEEEERKKSRFKIYGMLLKEPTALAGILPSIVAGATPIFGQWLLGLIINAMAEYATTGKSALDQVATIMIYSAIMGVVTAIAKFFDSFFWVRAGSRISVKVKDEIFQSIMRCDVSFYDVTPIGQILTVLGEDTAVIQECFGTTKSMQLQCFGQFFIGTILVYVYTWKIGLIMTALVPIFIIIMRSFHPYIEKNAHLRFRHIALSITLADETLAAIRTVKGFNVEEKNMERFKDKTEEAATYDKMITLLLVTMFTIVMTMMWCAVLGCFYFGATMVGHRENGRDFSVGSLFSLFGFMMFGCMGLIQLQNMIQAENRAVNAGVRIIRMISHQSLVNFEGGATYDDFKGHIEFKNVSFMYPTRNKMALVNVSFEVAPGQTAALVGHSGSGKSTCVQLLERYYDVTEGIILIDGHDIRELDPRWLHTQIGLVSQEPTLFQKSIRNNVLYGVRGEKRSDEEIWAALESANAKKFVMKLDGQLDYMAGDRGNSLSGGQKQRIAIARAIIKDPVIMITDEATSALDAESEKKVQAALDKILATRTGVVVAHRLTTVRNADIIYVFDAGKLVEQGKHNELIAKKGQYYNLVFRQLTAEDREVASEEKSEEKKNENEKEKKSSSSSLSSSDSNN